MVQMKKKLLLSLFALIPLAFYCQKSTGNQPALADSDEVFMVVEEMPSFVGGESELRKFFQQNIHYPSKELNEGITGKVYVQFLVEKDGSLTDVKVTRGIKDAEGLSQEAIRVVKSDRKSVV